MDGCANDPCSHVPNSSCVTQPSNGQYYCECRDNSTYTEGDDQSCTPYELEVWPDDEESLDVTNEQSLNVNPCQNNPCRNGGTCVTGGTTYQCDCLEGYSGEHCESKSIQKSSRHKLNSGATLKQQLVEMRDEITSIIELDDTFKKSCSRRINRTLSRIARTVNNKREKLEQKQKDCPEAGWNWKNNLVSLYKSFGYSSLLRRKLQPAMAEPNHVQLQTMFS